MNDIERTAMEYRKLAIFLLEKLGGSVVITEAELVAFEDWGKGVEVSKDGVFGDTYVKVANFHA